MTDEVYQSMQEILIPADGQKPQKSRLPWRLRASNFVWFSRSVRTQILIVFIALNAVAASVAGGVVIFKASVSTRIEIAASMRLAGLMVNEAVQLIQQGTPAEQFLRKLPNQLALVRHVRVLVRDAAGQLMSGPVSAVADGRPLKRPISGEPEIGAAERPEPPQEAGRATAPAWFAMLIGPPVERHEEAVVVDGHRVGTVEIVSEPRDEIAEVWSNTMALAAVAAMTVLVIVAILYLVLGRVLDPLIAFSTALRGLESRNYKVRLNRPKVLEFALLADRFNALAGALDAARTENLALNRRLITAQDDERRRTALELHDEVGPSLFGLNANVASIATAASGLPGEAAAQVAERVGDLATIIDHLQGINRGMLNRLRPMALGHVPLADIVAELVREREREHPHIVFTHDVATLDRGYDDTVDLTLYRCVQESLTNAIRHASAKKIDVKVAAICGAAAGGTSAVQGPSLELTVRDDGFGIAAGQEQGFGLRGMQERVHALGGEFAIESAQGRGACVRIVIPLPPRSAGSAPSVDYASTFP
jgi:two-component system, NarL family, sensor histidine kinase UhpB